MSLFEDKYIPLLDSITYTIEIKPKKVDPHGRIRTPEEIKNGTKEFLHSIYIDKIGNVYIIPMKLINGDCVEYYTHEDIIKLGKENKFIPVELDESPIISPHIFDIILYET